MVHCKQGFPRKPFVSKLLRDKIEKMPPVSIAPG